MNYVGVDLHKKSITACVVSQAREVLQSRGWPGTEASAGSPGAVGCMPRSRGAGGFAATLATRLFALLDETAVRPYGNAWK